MHLRDAVTMKSPDWIIQTDGDESKLVCSPSSRLPLVPQQPEYQPVLPGSVENGSAQWPASHPNPRRATEYTQGLRGSLRHHQRVCKYTTRIREMLGIKHLRQRGTDLKIPHSHTDDAV